VSIYTLANLKETDQSLEVEVPAPRSVKHITQRPLEYELGDCDYTESIFFPESPEP